MQRVAEWLGGARHRAILLAAALFMVPLLMPLAAAMMAFVTLLRGPREGALASLAAAAVLGLVTLLSGGAPMASFIAALAVLLAVVGATALMRRTDSLSLAFQVAVLGAAVLASLVALSLRASGADRQLAEQFAELVQTAGAAGAEAEQLAAMLVQVLPGLAMGGLLISVTVALLLGCWLHDLAVGRESVGARFRRLTVGRLITLLASAALIAALLAGGWVANAAVVFVLAFVLQGLAVVHAQVALRGWPPLVLVGLYALLLLPTPLSPALVTGVMTVGYLDNWLGFRRVAQASDGGAGND